MNQPTREEFERLEEGQKRLEEEVRQLREQITEPMKVTRIEVASEDVLKRLDELKQEFHTVSNTWLDTLQEHYTEHTEAISGVKTVQSGHSKFFEEHGKRLAATATKDDISRLEARLDTTATKDDLTAMQGQIKQDTGTIETRLDRMESDITSMKTTQEQILQLLQQKG